MSEESKTPEPTECWLTEVKDDEGAMWLSHPSTILSWPDSVTMIQVDGRLYSKAHGDNCPCIIIEKGQDDEANTGRNLEAERTER